MTPQIIVIIVLTLIVLVLGFALMNKSVNVKATLEEAVTGSWTQFAPGFEARVEDTLDGVLQKAELWLTDTADEDAAIAKATAAKIRKRAALEKHVAALQEHLNKTASPQ